MKRRALLRHLRQNGCQVVGEGRKHTHVRNLANGRRSVVPRHTEINSLTAEEICQQLGVPPPPGK